MTLEIREELEELISGRIGVADGILPPLLFVVINAVWGVAPAAIGGIVAALAITGWRLAHSRPIRFAVGGLLGTAIAAGLALRSGSAEDYFLPGILSGAATTAGMLVSVPLRRPAVAYTSWLTRGWPLSWYWHAQVRPAYARATLLWAGFFGARTAVQWRLFVGGEVEWLAVMRLVLGWPALLPLLVATYVLGRRWLAELSGPSIAEFESEDPPPWKGQPSGF